MRAFSLACLALIVIGVGAYFFLGTMQEPSGVAYATDGARIDVTWAWRSPTTNESTKVSPEECNRLKSWQWASVDFGRSEAPACAVSQ